MKQQSNLLPSGKDYVKKTFLTVCVNIPCLPNSVKEYLVSRVFHSYDLSLYRLFLFAPSATMKPSDVSSERTALALGALTPRRTAISDVEANGLSVR